MLTGLLHSSVYLGLIIVADLPLVDCGGV